MQSYLFKSQRRQHELIENNVLNIHLQKLGLKKLHRKKFFHFFFITRSKGLIVWFKVDGIIEHLSVFCI